MDFLASSESNTSFFKDNQNISKLISFMSFFILLSFFTILLLKFSQQRVSFILGFDDAFTLANK